MNKKGFTLVELILVVVIIGIISAITIPSIMDALGESKASGGESVEKLLKTNLELYNNDNMEDLWCMEDSNCSKEEMAQACLTVSLETLYNMNPDIDFGDCVLKDQNSLVIKRESPDSDKFSYHVNIACSSEFKKDSDHILDSDKNGVSKYYETQGFQGC